MNAKDQAAVQDFGPEVGGNKMRPPKEQKGNGGKDGGSVTASPPDLMPSFSLPDFTSPEPEVAEPDPVLEAQVAAIAGIKEGAPAAAAAGIAQVVGIMMNHDQNERQAREGSRLQFMETLMGMSNACEEALGVNFDLPASAKKEISALVKAAIFARVASLMPEYGGNVKLVSDMTKLVTVPWNEEDRDKSHIAVLRSLTDEEFKLSKNRDERLPKAKWDALPRKDKETRNEVFNSRRRLHRRTVGAGKRLYVLCDDVSREMVADAMTEFTAKWEFAVGDRRQADNTAYGKFREQVTISLSELVSGVEGCALVKNGKFGEIILKSDGDVVWMVSAHSCGHEITKMVGLEPRRQFALSTIVENLVEGENPRRSRIRPLYPAELSGKRAAQERYESDLVKLWGWLRYGIPWTLQSEEHQESCNLEEEALRSSLVDAGVTLAEPAVLANRKETGAVGGCVVSHRHSFAWEHKARKDPDAKEDEDEKQEGESGDGRRRDKRTHYSRLAAAIEFGEENSVTVHGWADRNAKFFAPGMEGVEDVEAGKKYPKGYIPFHLFQFIAEWRRQQARREEHTKDAVDAPSATTSPPKPKRARKGKEDTGKTAGAESK